MDKELFEYFGIYEFDINSNKDTTNLINSMWKEIKRLNNYLTSIHRKYKIGDAVRVKGTIRKRIIRGYYDNGYKHSYFLVGSNVFWLEDELENY